VHKSGVPFLVKVGNGPKIWLAVVLVIIGHTEAVLVGISVGKGPE